MIEFRLLGSVDLKGPEGTFRSVLAQPKRIALLTYLALAKPSGFHRRDKLLGLFWPESDQEHGRAALRKAVYLLRQSLGEEVIVSRGDEEVGLGDGAAWCDAGAFEEALEAGEPEEALELYRGHLLEGFYIAEAPEFERWLEGERERLRGRASEAAWTLAEQEEADGSSVRAASWARRAVSFSPDDEGGFRRLLELLDRVGDRAGAMKEYEAFARRLEEEYEGEPSPETQALIAAIREREVAAAGGSVGRPLKAQGGARADALGPVARAPAMEREDESRPISLPRVLGSYALVSLAVLAAVHIFTIQLGLPDWFFPSAVVVLLVCLPIIVATALVQGAAISATRAGAEVGPRTATARRWLTWRNAMGVTVIAFAMLGLAVAGYVAMRKLGIGPLATLIAQGVLEERDRIVLAQFENHTADSTLGLVITELLRTDLQQSPVVSVAERDFVAAVVRRMEKDPDQSLDYQTAREVAIREGLKAVVAGQVGSLGSGFVISARLVVAESGEVVFAHRETAEDGDALIPASEGLSRRLRERIGESLKSIRNTPRLWRMQTASLEALRLASEADEEIRRGRPSRSVELASRAIELDSLFMGAYMARAMAGGGSGQRMADLKKAYALRDRGSLTGRYFIEALYHGAVTGDEDRQLEALKMCLEVNPRLEGALQLLGLFYFRRARDYARAEEYFRRRLEQNRYGGTSWHMLFEALAAQGKWEEAEEALRRWQENIPEHPDIPVVRRHLAASRGDYRAAEAQTLALGEQHRGEVGWRAWTSYWLAVLARLQGRLAEAERHLDDATDARVNQGRTDRAIFLSSVKGDIDRWFKGDTTAALRRMEAALDRWPLDSITFTDQVYEPYSWIVDSYAQAGRIEEAKAYLAQYEAQTEYKNNRRFRMWRHWFRGAIAQAEGRARDAIEEYRQADRLSQCHVCVVPRLAFAYDQGGEPDSALAVYERYVTMPWPYRVERADSWWLAFAYERLGDLYDQRGDTAKAILYYGKLVDLWKDADPELQPRVEAARRAIEALSPDT